MTLTFAVISDVGVTDDTNEEEHTVVLAFHACVLDTSSITTPTDVNIAAGVKLGEYTVWVGELEIEVVDTATPVTEVRLIEKYLFILGFKTIAYSCSCDACDLMQCNYV